MFFSTNYFFNLHPGVDPSSGPLLYAVWYPVYFSDGYKSLMPCSKHDGKGLQLPLSNVP
jgi:hypothetical protein